MANALKRRGALTIWFDPEMSWDAVPAVRRGRQRTYSDAVVQTCLSMKVLLSMVVIGSHPLHQWRINGSLPPRKNAKPWKTVTAGAGARNEVLRAAKHLGRTL